MIGFNIYRLHTKNCPYRSEGRAHTKCGCPIHAAGYVNGKRVRKSLNTRDWSKAVRRAERWEDNPAAIERPASTIPRIISAYLADCETRGLAESTRTSYGKLLAHFAAFCSGAGVMDAEAITIEVLTHFRNGRRGRSGSVKPSTARKELEAMRAFLQFCVDREWLRANFARRLKPPKEATPPTLPFEPEEVSRIIAACDRIDNHYTASAARARLRARAMVLTFLYSGLRISDLVKLERSRLDMKSGRLLIRVMKTGVPLYLRLNQQAIDALINLPVESKYFFWSGESLLSTAIGSARRTIECVMRLSGVAGHPHRFRDTFACELLAKGADLRTVQLLLGHTSIRTTEKHYAHFVRSHQRIVDEALSHLDFSGGQSAVDPLSNTGGDAKRNVLPFPARR